MRRFAFVLTAGLLAVCVIGVRAESPDMPATVTALQTATAATPVASPSPMAALGVVIAAGAPVGGLLVIALPAGTYDVTPTCNGTIHLVAISGDPIEQTITKPGAFPLTVQRDSHAAVWAECANADWNLLFKLRMD